MRIEWKLEMLNLNFYQKLSSCESDKQKGIFEKISFSVNCSNKRCISWIRSDHDVFIVHDLNVTRRTHFVVFAFCCVSFFFLIMLINHRQIQPTG
ncbi:hypothetical protein T01_3151 [Trichinella spiralis]|uniref:Uncharacterized protein n=1 Tax=Trichinella spiralis TaxID=6334 RepID=A0A0V1BQF5_TRISP|nr:hypothetical protein T01_3151 [Trichinella spiralis]